MPEDKNNLLKEKYDLVTSDTYKKIREYQINKILELATSNIEPLELKGMLKTISKTDNWKKEYENEFKKRSKVND